MTNATTTRRAFLFGSAVVGTAALLPLQSRAAGPAMHVLKDPNCGCCSAWVEILNRRG